MEGKDEQVVRRKGKTKGHENMENKTAQENQETTSDKNEENPKLSSTTTCTSKEYTQAVSDWLAQYRMHQWMQQCSQAQQAMMMAPYLLGSAFPPVSPFTPPGNLPSTSQGNGVPGMPTYGAPTVGGASGNTPNTQQPQVPQLQAPPMGQFPFQFPQPFPPNIPLQQPQQQQQQQQQQPTTPNIPQLQASEFTLPSLYRRITAEVIDFILLFIVKFGITLFIIEYMGIVDPSSFMMRFLIEEIDEDSTFEDLQQMLLFALIYRAVVCTYETFFLRFGLGTRVGGATPGKYCMGLRVVSCDRVQSLGGNRVLVTSPEDLTYLQAFLRAIIKNFSMAFFFPACITVFFNPHFRAAYGILTRTVVVSVPNWAERLRPQNR